MNYRGKILLDRTLGIPVAVFVNQCIRFHRWWVGHPPVRKNDDVRVVVVSKIVGMGSVIQMIPMLNALRDTFPKAKILFLTSDGNAEMVERLPGVDEIIKINDKCFGSLLHSTTKAVVKLWMTGPDIYIDCEVYSSLSSILGAMTGAGRRFGFYRKSCAFKEGIFTDLIFFNTAMPVWRLFHQLARISGAREIAPSEAPRFGPIGRREQDKTTLAEKWDKDLKYVLVNVNASDLLLERRWASERFVGVIDSLNSEGVRVVLTGSAGEAGYVDSTLVCVKDKQLTESLAGKLNLGEFIELMAQASAVITNDTGPMHLAAALGVPTVALFGPVSPDHYALPSNKTITISHPVSCGPCLHHSDLPPCRGKNICMEKITIDEVLAAYKKVVDPSFHANFAEDKTSFTGQDGVPLGYLKAFC